jgi:hypothetical protein
MKEEESFKSAKEIPSPVSYFSKDRSARDIMTAKS